MTEGRFSNRELPGTARIGVALVTGSRERVAPVAGALRAEGFETVSADAEAPIGDLSALVEPGSVRCYVQLPTELSAEAARTSLGRVLAVVDGLLWRLEAVMAVAPLLAPYATVLLVGGRSPAIGRELRRHEHGLLTMLADALHDDNPKGAVRALMVDDGSPAEIAALARHQVAPPSGERTGSERATADWREEGDGTPTL